MVCLADPAVRKRARRDIKDMIEKRLTYRKEALLHDEIPPIPNVRRTPKELSRSPVYKRTKTMIPKRINKILINKSRQVFNETQISGSPESDKNVTVSSTYLDSDHDFGYYNRSKRKKSTTIQDLTLQLKETRRLLDVLKESEEVSHQEISSDKPVRRRIDMGVQEVRSKKRQEPKIADFVSAKELDCESIGSDSEVEVEKQSPQRESTKRTVNNDKFDVKSSYRDDDLQEFEKLERSVSKRSLSGGSVPRDESDPFTDSDYMEIGVNLQDELDISKEYESDGFSMCSEKISHVEARKMLSESEQRFSAILDSLDPDDPDDSFLENERLMQQQTSRLEDIMSIPSSVEDLRFDKEELPLLTRSTSDTESTVTEKERNKVMVPVRPDLQDRPSLKFSKQTQGEEGRVIQPTPIKPTVKKPSQPAKAKENIDFNNYESDLNEIENLLFKYDEYRMEQELKKSDKKAELGKKRPEKTVVAETVEANKDVKQEPTKKISDGIGSKHKASATPKSAAAVSDPGGLTRGIKTGIAKGVKTNTAIKKPLIAPKTVSTAKASAKPPSISRAEKLPPKSPGKTLPKSSDKDVAKEADNPTVNKKLASPGKRSLIGSKPAAEKALVSEKTVPASSVSKIAAPKKSVAISKPVARDSSGQKLTKPAVSPNKTATKSKAVSPSKITPSSVTTAVSSKTDSTKSSDPSRSSSNNRSSTADESRSPIKSDSKPAPVTKTKPPISFRASPPKTLTKIPASRLGTSNGNYVKSAKMATAKSPAISTSTHTSGKEAISEMVKHDVNNVKKTDAPASKKALKSSPTKGATNSKLSSPKSRLLPVKPTPGRKSTIPKLPPNQGSPSDSTSTTTKSKDQPTKPSTIPSKTKSTAASEKPASTTKSSAVAMKPSVASKNDVASKPSIASKLAATATSSSKSKSSPEARPSLNSAMKGPTRSLSKSAGISPPKASKPKGTTSNSAEGAPDKKATNDAKSIGIVRPGTKSIGVSGVKGALNQSTRKPLALSNDVKASTTASASISTASKTSPAKTSSTKTSPAKITPAKTSPIKTTTPTANSPKKTFDSSKPQKESATSKPAIIGAKPASKLSPPKATSTPRKSTAHATKTLTSPTKPSTRTGTSPTTTVVTKKSVSAIKPTQTEVNGESIKKSSPQDPVKEDDKSQSKVKSAIKSPTKPNSKIPSPSKSSPSTSPSKSPASKAEVSPNPKVPAKPEVSPKPKLKVRTKTSPVKTLQKQKPVMRF